MTVKLICPNGHAPVVTTRRGMIHAPCGDCALEGKGVVWRQVERPPEAPRSEPPERERPELPRPAPAALVASPEFKWDCQRDGHVYQGGMCHKCMRPEPLDPAALVVVVALLAVLSSLLAG